MFEQDIRLGPGTGTTTDHTLEILIMLAVAGLLGLWLGWILWSRYQQEAEKLRLDNASLSATAEALRLELAASKASLSAAESDNSNFAAQVASLNRNNANLRDRVAELEDLLSVTEARNRTVETELGLSYAPDSVISDDIPLEITDNLHEPQPPASDYETSLIDIPPIILTDDPTPQADIVLPTQPIRGSVTVEAALAEEAMDTPPTQEIVVEETIVPVIAAETPVSAEALANKPAPATKTRTKAKTASATTAEISVPIAASEPDDLTVVEGIGPKIQMLLNQYGIYTYRDLADTEVSRLKEILLTAGPQLAMHDPGTWPSQANLAANDQWDALKSIQGFLKGGKKPT